MKTRKTIRVAIAASLISIATSSVYAITKTELAAVSTQAVALGKTVGDVQKLNDATRQSFQASEEKSIAELQGKITNTKEKIADLMKLNRAEKTSAQAYADFQKGLSEVKRDTRYSQTSLELQLPVRRGTNAREVATMMDGVNTRQNY